MCFVTFLHVNNIRTKSVSPLSPDDRITRSSGKRDCCAGPQMPQPVRSHSAGA